jgi:TolA-binding protein
VIAPARKEADVRERERLIARIRQIRRASKAADAAQHPPETEPKPDQPKPDQLRALEARVEHLEALLQGLQDSVHREGSRQEKRLTDLEARTQPGALGKALSHDARERGL